MGDVTDDDDDQYADAQQGTSVPDTQHRNFATMLMAMENGDLVKHITREQKKVLGDLFGQVDHSGKKAVKGKLTIEVTYAVSDDGMVDMVAKVNSKTPEIPRRRSVLYTDADGNMHIRNPAEMDMFHTDGTPKRFRTAG